MALTATDISRFSGCGMTSASVAASVDEEYRPKRVVQRFFLFWRHGCSAARNSPACKGKSLRCLRKCRFSYIDTSPALSARRHLTAALRYSACPPQGPSRSHLGCQTHQTYYFAHLQNRPHHVSRLLRQQVRNFDLSQRFWCRGLWGVGFNEAKVWRR
jgi:hypothetical protein